MHAAARGFLASQGLIGDGAGQIDPSCTFFELTKEAKVQRIAALGCDVFIDDLPEIFGQPGFPAATRPMLFDPIDQFRDIKFASCSSWAWIAAELCREHV